MPDGRHFPRWPLELERMEREVAGDDRANPYYSDGWHACMQWEARVPPADLSPDDAAEWRRGWEDAYDAPLGSAAP